MASSETKLVTSDGRGQGKIFVSYSTEDQAFVERISRILADSGISVSTDANIRLGEEIEQALRSQIKEADKVLFVVPSREGAGKNALVELGMAYGLGKNIIAVVPNEARGWNAGIARQLSGGPVVDASRVNDQELLHLLMAPAA